MSRDEEIVPHETDDNQEYIDRYDPPSREELGDQAAKI